MIAPLKKVAVIKPGEALKNADPQVWHYSNKFNPDKVSENHEDFIKTLKDFGTEVYFMSEDDKGIADSVFTYDASLMTPTGAIIMSPGKKLRSGEQTIHRQFYENNKIPVIGSVEGEAKAEAYCHAKAGDQAAPKEAAQNKITYCTTQDPLQVLCAG